MKNPLISVIVPVFNVEDYIVSTIASLTEQSYKNLEIIFIDDGSNDKTPEYLKKAASSDERIKLFFKKNQGPSSARNFGLEMASGDYISFLDADDLILSNSYEQLNNVIERFEDVGLIAFGACLFYRNTPFLNTTPLNCHCGNKITKQEFFNLLFDNSFKSKYSKSGYIWNKLYRRDILKNIKFNENRKYYEDEEFLIDVYNNLRSSDLIVHFDVPLYFYRQRISSSIHDRRLTRLFALYSCRRSIEHKLNDHSEQDLIHLSRVKTLFKIGQIHLLNGYQGSFKRLRRIVFSNSTFPLKNKLSYLMGHWFVKLLCNRSLSKSEKRHSKRQFWP